MATLVKILRDKHSNELFAYFPQLNFTKGSNGTVYKTCYAPVGQHSACSVQYAKECEIVPLSECNDLVSELTSIGYNLRVLNK